MSVDARQTKFGINLATAGSWGTGTADATAVGAGDGHRVLDDVGQQLQMQQSLDDSAGQSFIGSVQTGNAEAVRIPARMYLHYGDTFQNVLWGLAFGTGGTAPARISTTTAYSNTFEPATSQTTAYATIVRDKVGYISETPGAKCSGFEITFGEAGRAEITWNLVGDLEKNDSSINTSTQISALTFPTLGNRAFMRQAVFRMNAQAGGALASGDAIPFTSLRLMFNKALDVKHVSGQTSIIEPKNDGFLSCTLELELPRFETATDAFFDAHRDTTLYKADLTLTGPQIEGANNYALLFQFPHVSIPSYQAPVPGGSGQIVPRMTVNCMSTTSAPTGMTGVTVPIRLTTTGISTVNPFA